MLAEGGSETRLDPRVVMLWRRQGLLLAGGTALATATSLLWVVLAGGPALPVGAAGLAASAAVAGFTRWLAARRFAHWSYCLGGDALQLRHGAFIRRHSVIPYFRVQHVDTSAGPLERRLGLARLKIHTASPRTDAGVPGLAASTAAELRAAILGRIGSGEGV